MVEYSISALICSDILLDKDVGLIRLISSNYRNEEYFDDLVIDDIASDLDAGKYLLYKRQNPNPLSVISTGSMTDENLNELYEEFINTKYDNIVQLSMFTDVHKIISKFSYSNGTVIPTILCKTEYEKEYILGFFSTVDIRNINIVVEKDLSKIDLSMYDTIYMKYFKDVIKFNETLNGKSIIVSGGEYNYTSIPEANFHEPIPELLIYVSNKDCEISLIDMYLNLEAAVKLLDRLKEQEGDEKDGTNES
jgi:hypothetical protein